LGMLLATVNVAKFAQKCPKQSNFAKICPKTIILRNFEMPPKFEIFIFIKKIKICM
jgi:hypothetical protein